MATWPSVSARGAPMLSSKFKMTVPAWTRDFVRNELFRPFRTTKDGGFGIGVYESREFVRELGGRMEVDSAKGHGTTIRISVPAMRSANATDESLRGIEVL